MPTTHKIDLYDGTFAYRDYLDGGRGDRASRVAIFRFDETEPLANTNQALGIAIAELAATYPNHPSTTPFGTLPLKAVSAARFGPRAIKCVLQYGRLNTVDVFDHPSRVKGQLGTRNIEWYSNWTLFTNGLPSGPLNYFNGTSTDGSPPTPWMWSQPTLDFDVPFNQTASPLIGSAFYVGKVNDAPTTFSGVPFPAFSLRFEGMVFNWRPTAGSEAFTGVYRFKHVRGGFYRQRVKKTGSTWAIEPNFLVHQTAPFGDFGVPPP